jgi:hypothetical protein
MILEFWSIQNESTTFGRFLAQTINLKHWGKIQKANFQSLVKDQRID